METFSALLALCVGNSSFCECACACVCVCVGGGGGGGGYQHYRNMVRNDTSINCFDGCDAEYRLVEGFNY